MKGDILFNWRAGFLERLTEEDVVEYARLTRRKRLAYYRIVRDGACFVREGAVRCLRG